MKKHLRRILSVLRYKILEAFLSHIYRKRDDLERMKFAVPNTN